MFSTNTLILLIRKISYKKIYVKNNQKYIEKGTYKWKLWLNRDFLKKKVFDQYIIIYTSMLSIYKMYVENKQKIYKKGLMSEKYDQKDR